MRLASFLHGGRALYGVVEGGKPRPASEAMLAACPTLRDVLATGRLAEMARGCGAVLDGASFLPPIPNPARITCIGMNYRKPYPVAGVAPPDPDNIVTFARHPDTLVGDGAALEQPAGAAAQTFDFEGEVAVVIGRPGRHVSEADALDHVLGYAPMNEGSVRAWMKHSVHAGKNFHASGSWGPWITTVDEAGPFDALELVVRVNGAVMQSCGTDEMIFSLPRIIAYLSHLGPLSPGDVIATGSPDGTGGSRTPPAFLRAGDRVEVEVSGVGVLRNRVAGRALSD